MKRLVVLAVVLHATVLLFAGGREDFSLGFPIRGNGDLVTTEKPVSNFTNIEISRNASVYYHESPEYRAVVTVDSNLDEYVRVYTQNGVLHIGAKRGRHYLFTQYTVNVYAPSISGLSISGFAQFEGKDKITASSFRLRISGSGEVNGDFQCDDFSAGISGSGGINCNVICNGFDADISGAGKMELRGNSNFFDISVSGSGDLYGREFQANSADIRISGAGTVNLWVLDNLRASISGAGRVRYRGNPKIDFRGSGAGHIESE